MNYTMKPDVCYCVSAVFCNCPPNTRAATDSEFEDRQIAIKLQRLENDIKYMMKSKKRRAALHKYVLTPEVLEKLHDKQWPRIILSALVIALFCATILYSQRWV